MKNFIAKVRSIPWWGWVSGFVLFGMQYGLYRLANTLSVAIGTINYAFEWKIPVVDDWFKVIPVFVIPYIYPLHGEDPVLYRAGMNPL